MAEETGLIRSGVQTIAETAVKIDRLLTEAKELTIKLRETSEALDGVVKERIEDAP